MRKVLVILPVIFFLSCQKEESTGKGILPKAKMVAVLKELHLAEAYVNANFNYSDSSKFLYKKIEDSILKTSGITLAEFDSSLHYYQQNIKEMDAIYATTIDSLSFLEGTANNTK